jgi:hypothetical protein
MFAQWGVQALSGAAKQVWSIAKAHILPKNAADEKPHPHPRHAGVKKQGFIFAPPANPSV